MNRRTAALTLTALACCMVASAQTTSTAGAVRGVIRDKGGKAVSGATVSLRNRETGLARTTSSNAEGEYRVGLLPVGTYEVTVTAPGMRTVKDANIQVLLGQNAIANFSIDRAEASAMVEVVGAAAGVDTKQINVITSVDSATIEAVPLVSRNFTDVAKLSPGVVAGNGNRMVVEGGRQIFNAIQIDGASNNSAFFNEQRGGVYTPFIFGADTIKELQIVTNGFDVQYAQAGATVNAVTKTGTNEFGGSALYQIRRTSWSAKPKAIPYDPNHTFNTPTNLQRFNDSNNINFNVGGALVKDTLWYFVGVERFHKSITANPIPTAITSAPGMTQTDFNNMVGSRLGQVLTNTSGLSLAQELGNPGQGTPAHSYPMENTNTVYFGRLDYSLNENHRFVLRMNYQTMTDTLLNTSANANNAESNNIPTITNAISWVLEANDIWTNELFTESRLQIAREARPMRNNSVAGVPSLEVPTSASFMAFGTKTSTPRESNENTMQLFSATTWNHGDIQIKGGLDLMKVDVDNQFFQNNAGRFQFGTYGAAAAWANGALTGATTGSDAGAITYSGAVSPYKGRIQMWTKTDGYFGQVQYSGLFDKRLTLTAGFRGVNQSFSNNPAPNPNFQGLDQATSAKALDPRLAFSYDLDGKGKTVIRGGYGTFTSPTPLLLHSNTMTGNGQIITNYSFSLTRNLTPPNPQLTAASLALFNSGLLSASNLISGTAMTKASDTQLAQIAAMTYVNGSGQTVRMFNAGASATSLWDPDNKLSRSKKASIGAEHDLGDNLVIGATFTYVRYENLQRFENINLTQTGGQAYNDGYAPGINAWSTATRPGYAVIRGHRVDFLGTTPGNPGSGFGDVFLVKTDGWGNYRGLSFSVKKTWDAKTGIMANVTYAKAQDTGSFERGTYTSANTNFSSELGASLTPDPQDPGSNYGYGDSDRRWVANVVAFFPIVWGIEGSVRGLYQSGLPYSAYLATDLNGDGMQNHFAPDHTRNDLRQPGYTQFDVRLSRNFKIYGKVEVEGIVDIYNLFNKAEFSVPSPNGYIITNAAFGQLGGVNKDRTRELQLGIRVKF